MGPEGNPHPVAPRRNAESPKSLGLGTPTTFFMATEDDVEKAQSPAGGSYGNFGIKSLEGTISSIADGQSTAEEEDVEDEDGRGCETTRRRSTLKPTLKTRKNTPEPSHTASPTATDGLPPRKLRRSSPPSASQSLASLSQASQGPGSSIPSSPKSSSNRSFRTSDEESVYEGGSQAIASSEEDEADLPSEIRDSAPQLIMPSIRMPSRRPFTDRGKNMGRLKILIAGDSGMAVPKACSQIQRVNGIQVSARRPW